MESSLLKNIVMVSLARGDSSCTLVMWFIAKFCMFFWGRYGQTKTQFFLAFKNPRRILVFVCHPFHLVMCSLFRLPGRSIAPFAINSRCFCVAISSRFQVFQPFSVSRFRAKNQFLSSRESRIPICCFKPQQWLQRSHPPAIW